MKFAAKLLVLGTLFAGGIAFAEATDPDVKARQELMKANGAAMKTLSDMAGGKATAVFDWAVAQGRECLLLDYSGCGASDGAFADGTLSRWRDEVLALSWWPA